MPSSGSDRGAWPATSALVGTALVGTALVGSALVAALAGPTGARAATWAASAFSRGAGPGWRIGRSSTCASVEGWRTGPRAGSSTVITRPS